VKVHGGLRGRNVVSHILDNWNSHCRVGLEAERQNGDDDEKDGHDGRYLTSHNVIHLSTRTYMFVKD